MEGEHVNIDNIEKIQQLGVFVKVGKEYYHERTLFIATQAVVAHDFSFAYQI